LSDVQKHYLVSSLRGEAKALIANLAITNDNFAVAWSLICGRYSNPKLIAKQHVGQLVQMPTVRAFAHTPAKPEPSPTAAQDAM
jgi:hypothetical protein